MNNRKLKSKFLKISYIPDMIKNHAEENKLSCAKLSRKIKVSNTFLCKIVNRKELCSKRVAYALEVCTGEPFYQQYIKEADEKNRYQWEELVSMATQIDKDKNKIMSKVEQSNYVVHHGCCNDLILSIPDNSIDVVFCDPPYPEIKRDYGRMSEPDWHFMMNRLIPEVRRVLKPNGSSVFVLQPNSKHIGSLRPWLWEFLAKWSKEWNMIQDVWWWNIASMPNALSMPSAGLCRTSVKICAWFGPKDCYRNQNNVLWDASEDTKAAMYRKRFKKGLKYSPGGTHVNEGNVYNAYKEKGGVTPFNILPIANTSTHDSAGTYGHGAGTPYDLVRWWLRYVGQNEGVVLDPFFGTGTTGIVAHDMGMKTIGFEKMEKYYKIAKDRMKEKYKQQTLSFEK
jgi:site-specific DNA-methyltransferase (cytosine-N4-specific)